MRRSGALGSTAGLTNVRRGRANAPVGGGGPEVRRITNETGTNLNWADGVAAPNLYDGSPGDNTTFYQQTSGSSAYVVGLYDLGSAQQVTRVRYRYGTVNGNSWSVPNMEASNDGENWVNAWIGAPGTAEFGTGTFHWAAEKDIPDANISDTPYRYWRVVIKDTFAEAAADARLGDFRLYVGGSSTPV